MLSCVHAITADGAQRCVRVVHQVAQALPRRNYRAGAILDSGACVHGALLQGPCTRGANRSHRRARHGASIASQARLAKDDHIIRSKTCCQGKESSMVVVQYGGGARVRWPRAEVVRLAKGLGRGYGGARYGLDRS